MEEKDNTIFSKLGIDINNDKIHIDINQTKDFFTSLQKQLENSAQNIQKDISEGSLDLGDKVGIKIDKEHVDIDLGKTKNFISELGSKVESFLRDIDKAVDGLVKK